MTRKEAIDVLDKMPLCSECDPSNMPYPCVDCEDAFLMAIDALRQPEIVRCKDCKHYKESQQGVPRTENRRYVCDEFNPDDDWFCADGERENG